MKKKWAVRIGVIGILLAITVFCVIPQGREKEDDTENAESTFLTNFTDVLQGEQEKDVDCTTLQMDFVDFPTEVSRQSLEVIQAPWKQQNCYRNEDGTKRLILEVSLISSDDTVRDESGFYEPESDEAIYEWTQSGMACKLFGTFTEEELESMAESVTVECNE